MKRKDFDFGEALKGYLGAMYSYWDSIRDGRLAIDAFAKCNGWEREVDCAGPTADPVSADSEGRTTLIYRNGCKDASVYVSFSWYQMQSGRMEITAYVAI